MAWYVYLLQFVSGLLVTNGIPHFVKGLCGERFQSPFARPSGIGLSSPLVNVYWGFANLAGGAALLAHFTPTSLAGWALVGAGALASGSFLARHLGKLHATPSATRSQS